MKSIRSRILFWIVVTTVGLLAILGVFITDQIKETILPLTEEMSAEIVKGNSAMLGEWLTERVPLKAYFWQVLMVRCGKPMDQL